MPNPGDLSYRRGAEARYPAGARYPAPQRPYRLQPGYAVPSPVPAEPPGLLVPAGPGHELHGLHGRPHRITRRRTWPRLAGGALIAAACVASAGWYVPRVIADRRLLTGTVSASGVFTLKFPASGQIGKVDVRLGQAVRKGTVLATEYAPDADSIVAADKAAIAAG